MRRLALCAEMAVQVKNTSASESKRKVANTTSTAVMEMLICPALFPSLLGQRSDDSDVLQKAFWQTVAFL